MDTAPIGGKSTFKLTTASASDPGQIRESNEDAVLDYARGEGLGEPLGLLMVADGMGGHQAGEVASRLAVETIYGMLESYLVHDDAEDTQPVRKSGEDANATLLSNGGSNILKRRLKAAIVHANKTIYEYAQQNPLEAGNLGTTLACVLIKGNTAIIANVGDSRVYLMRNQQLSRLTEDHSLVHHLVMNGQLAPEDMFDHPHRSVITRALGYNEDVQIDFVVQVLSSGDRLLVCSDGLWEMVRDEDQIAQLLRDAGDLPEAARQLIEIANSHGGLDNIGVAVGEFSPA